MRKSRDFLAASVEVISWCMHFLRIILLSVRCRGLLHNRIFNGAMCSGQYTILKGRGLRFLAEKSNQPTGN